jgi:hypothetical protein
MDNLLDWVRDSAFVLYQGGLPALLLAAKLAVLPELLVAPAAALAAYLLARRALARRADRPAPSRPGS